MTAEYNKYDRKFHIDLSDVLDKIPISQVTGHYETKALLEHMNHDEILDLIGAQKCIDYFGLNEAES